MSHPSELMLDALHLGAADGATLAHVQSCIACRARMRSAEDDRAHFVANVLPRQLPAIAARRSTWPWFIASAVVAAAAAAFLVVREPAPPALGIKGGPTLQIYASHDDRVVQLRDGMSLAPGDRIRFVVRGAPSQHLLIASIDGAGVASVYYPFGGTASARLPDAQTVELPGSVVLDDARGTERIYAFFGRSPIEAGPILAALRAGKPTSAQLQISFEKAP